MAINIGDAVLTMLGDWQQLDLAFDQVNQNAQTKLGPAAAAATGVGTELESAGKKGQEAGAKISESWMNVARATRENQQAQQQLRAALDSMTKSAALGMSNTSELAAAQQRAAMAAAALAAATKEATTAGEKDNVNMRERRESMAAIGELSGTTIPRGLRTWIAELPVVGAAMEAAFSGFAVLLLIDVLANGIEKLVEWHEAAEKLREEWTASDTEFRRTSTTIKEEIDAQEEKFLAITKGPMAAYEFGLKHIKSTFDETVGKIGSLLDSQGDKFIDRGGWFSALFGGADKANAKEAGKDLKEFAAELQEVGKKAQDTHPENVFAGMDAMINSVNGKIATLNEQIEKEQIALKDAEAYQKLHGGSILGIDVASLERARTVLQEAGKLLQDFRDKEAENRKTETARIKSDELAHLADINIAKINAAHTAQLAILAIAAEGERIAFDHGKESLDKFLAQQKENETSRYNIERDGLQQRLDLANQDKVRNEKAIIDLGSQIEQARIQHHLNMLKIDESGYKQQADQVVKAMSIIAAATKDGSEDRINAEQAILDFLEVTFGRESDAYLSQAAKVTAAIQAHTEIRRNLAKEEAHFVQASAEQQEQSQLAYYSFLRSTAQISATQLLQIQQESSERTFQIKRAALVNELNQLGPQEEISRKKVNDQLLLLDQKHEQDRRLLYVQTQSIIELQYQQLGIKSTMMIMRERNESMEAYRAIAASGTASYGQILQAQIKVLQATVELNAAEGKNTAKDQAALDKLVQTYNRWNLSIQHTNQGLKLQETILKAVGVDATLMGSKIQNVALGATAALGKMFEAWAQGGVTVAQACEQITAAILQSIAQYAFAQAVVELAKGFAALAPTSPDFGHSGEHFTSAALWFAAGAATSIVAGAISGASHGSSSGSSGGSLGGSSSATDSGSNTPPPPVQSVNVQSFAGGGLITRRTLAMIGDSKNGGDAREAAIPLDDPRAMAAVGDAIAPHLDGAGSIHNHFHIKGLVSPDSLTKVMNQMNRKVKRGQGNLVASNALRTTKRSN